MSTTSSSTRLLALATGALLCLGVPAHAAVVEVLQKNVDTDSAKFEEYRDFDSGLRLTYLRLFGESPDKERAIDFTVINAPRKDARYTLAWGKPGRYSLLLDYNQIQHRFANNGKSLWLRTGPGVLEVPDFVQSNLQNSLNANRDRTFFPFLNELISPVFDDAPSIDLALQRNRALISFGYGSMSRFGWGVTYAHENKHGTRPFGGSFGIFNATEVPEPIDHDTDNAEIAGEWKGKAGGLRVGYRHSTFKNKISTLIWDNPLRLTDSTGPTAFLSPTPLSTGGSSHGISDLAPDNDSDAIFVNGRAQLGKSWSISGSATRNQMKQDDPLLPYAINRAIRLINDDGTPFDATSTSTLPRQNAGREAVTTNVNAQLGGRFGLWDLTFRYRYFDYDNKSPVTQFVGYALFHSTFIIEDRRTVSYAYRQQDATADLGFRLGASSRLGLSYTRRNLDREFREVASSDEDIAKLTFDSHPSDRWDIQAGYEHGDRSIGNYDVLASVLTYVNPPGPFNNPDVRKFDEADRTYDALRTLVQLYATDALSFAFGVSGRSEDYDRSILGLISDDTVEYNAEVSFTPTEKMSFFLFGTVTDRDSFLRSRESGGIPSPDPANDWQVKLTELTDTAGLGVNSRLSSRWTADLTAQWSHTDGKADFDRATGIAVDFGNYDDIELLAILAKVDYELNKHLSAGLSYRWEDYTIDSFLTNGLRNYLPGALLLNGNNGDYRGRVVGLNVNVNW
jgi:MtrB/PioB family decaheme-associated outer membrane protein